MPLWRDYIRNARVRSLMAGIAKDVRLLEVGSGDGWFVRSLRENGWQNAVGLDIVPPADIVGDIRNWRGLGLKPESFDVIAAFEVVEHVDCFREMYDLLRPGGMLLLTTPVPHWDWLCKILEAVGINQKRTSPHDHLVYFRDIPLFEPVDGRIRFLIGQWGTFRKPVGRSPRSALDT